MIATYDDQDRLLAYGAEIYSYTDEGDIKLKTDTNTGETTSYTHNVFHNLIAVSLPDGKEVEYIVDGKGRRIAKKVNGDVVKGFLYEGDLNPIAEIDSSGNVVSRFVYAENQYSPAYMQKSGKTYRIISDHIGSPRLVVDIETGRIVQRIDYDEWGRVLNDTNPGFQPFGFAGGIFDGDTGLVKFGARDYAPYLGRFVQSDPINLAGGLNTYVYANVNPIMFIDPLGLSAEDVQRIKDSINQSIRDMVDGGHRRPGKGFWNGYLNNVERMWTENYQIYDCWDQSYYTNNQLRELKSLDDDWEFEIVEGIGHATGRATSSNIDDPIINYDPWRGLID